MKDNTVSQFKQQKKCIQCGTCCLNNAPTLHIEDISLIEKGNISKKYLYTIRAGEKVYNNVYGKIDSLDNEIIKIKGLKNSWTCYFYQCLEKKCSIYENRPFECRILKCWDTDDFIKKYLQTRLSRKNIINKNSALFEIIEDHEKNCSFEIINNLLNKKNHQPDQKKLKEIINYDYHIRNLIITKGKIDPLILDFLFGRPLTNILN